MRCIEMERQALLKFREGLKDPSNGLSSWVGQDCCTWFGVGCNNQTGNVIKLDLKRQFVCNQLAGSEFRKKLTLDGELSPSLLDLKYLNYLDLSYNDFQGIPIPNFIGSLNKLSFLDHSYASFSGTIPPHLGNLSNLSYLSLSSFSFSLNLSVSNLNWLSGLSSLQYLSLSGVSTSKATTHWLQVVNMLPSLVELDLSDCKLQNLPQTLQFVNFASLSVIDLSRNDFNSSLIPQWLFDLTALTNLQLSSCNLKGSIPEISRGSLCNLRRLDLLQNYYISGKITEFFQDLSGCGNISLEEVDFSWNMLSGNLPSSLGYFEGLKCLHLSVNSFSGPIPENIGNLSSQIYNLDLSNNQLSGNLPGSLKFTISASIDLSFNLLEGSLPIYMD